MDFHGCIMDDDIWWDSHEPSMICHVSSISLSDPFWTIFHEHPLWQYGRWISRSSLHSKASKAQWFHICNNLSGNRQLATAASATWLAECHNGQNSSHLFFLLLSSSKHFCNMSTTSKLSINDLVKAELISNVERGLNLQPFLWKNLSSLFTASGAVVIYTPLHLLYSWKIY